MLIDSAIRCQKSITILSDDLIYLGGTMKTVILAGGFGTRISEESVLKPKPMVEIGGKPILWHIMKNYAHYGYTDFIICAGYKQDVIKQYFFDYYLHNADVSFDLATNSMQVLNSHAEPWNVTVVDTGLNTMTGGRIKRVQPYVGNEPFMLTYGDGVADIDLKALETFHRAHGKTVTMSSYNVGQQFGVLDVGDDGLVTGFREKQEMDGSMINIGFMVCEPGIFDVIDGDDTVLEKKPLETLAAQGQLQSRCHTGFWKCMDTVRDKNQLESLWASGKAPWKLWQD